MSYAVVAYWTAYFKANHPVEFMTCVLNAYQGNDRMGPVVAECMRLGIPVLPPDVNRSGVDFGVDRAEDGREAVRFGLASIKNIGASAVAELVTEREENGPFQSLEDFCKRAGSEAANRRVIESLTRVGALDAYGSRGRLAASADHIVHLMQREARLRDSGQSTMFDMFGASAPTPLGEIELLPAPEPTVRELVTWERELIGVALGRRVLDPVSAPAGAVLSREEVEGCPDGEKVLLAGEVASIRLTTDKQGRQICFAGLEIFDGSVLDVAVWSRVFEKTAELWEEGNLVEIRGVVRRRGDETSVHCDEAVEFEVGEPTADLSSGPVAGPATPRVEEWKPPMEERPSVPPEPAANTVEPHSINGAAPHVEAVPSVGGFEEGQRKVLVKMKETDRPSEDNLLLKQVLQTLMDYPGTDEVDLVIESGGQFWRISMPIIRTRYSDELAAHLNEMRDAGLTVELESTAA